MIKKNLKKQIKYLLFIVMVFPFCIMTAGCHDAKDINEKLIATAVACDFKDDEILFYVEFADISKRQGSDGGAAQNISLLKPTVKPCPKSGQI